MGYSPQGHKESDTTKAILLALNSYKVPVSWSVSHGVSVVAFMLGAVEVGVRLPLLLGRVQRGGGDSLLA